MDQSILTSVKKNLGLASDYTAFDQDVLTYINSAFSTLHQLGVGPSDGFEIVDDEAEWADFFGPDPRLNQIKTYVCLKVRILFDPPTTSYLIGAIDKQIAELEWRINTHRESTAWVDPDLPDLDSVDNYGDPIILDGGGA